LEVEVVGRHAVRRVEPGVEHIPEFECLGEEHLLLAQVVGREQPAQIPNVGLEEAAVP
jgi:hypothetical protein